MFGVNWLLGLGGEAKNRFSRWLPWRPSWISNRHDFSYFWSTVTPMLRSKFGVNWPFGSGEEAKNTFSRWLPRRPSWIPIGTILLFLIYKSPRCFLASLESIDLSVQEKKWKNIFKMVAILDFRSEWFQLFLIYKSPRCFLPSIESIGSGV